MAKVKIELDAEVVAEMKEGEEAKVIKVEEEAEGVEEVKVEKKTEGEKPAASNRPLDKETEGWLRQMPRSFQVLYRGIIELGKGKGGERG